VVEQRVVPRKPTRSRTIVTELGLDQAAPTTQVTITASSETSMVTDWDKMPRTVVYFMQGKKGIWLPKKELEGPIHVCAKDRMAGSSV
jgi:hypothetical protein